MPGGSACADIGERRVERLQSNEKICCTVASIASHYKPFKPFKNDASAPFISWALHLVLFSSRSKYLEGNFTCVPCTAGEWLQRKRLEEQLT